MALVQMTRVDLDAAPIGAVLTLARDDGDDVTYTKGDDGLWVPEAGEALSSVALGPAADRQRVFRTEPIEVGDWIHNNTGYYRLLRVCHGRETYAWCTNGRFRELVTEVRGQLRKHADNPMPPEWQRAADTASGVLVADQTDARLAQILSSGVIPDEVERQVTVRVEGVNWVQPTDEQAKVMLGDEAEIVSVETTPVGWAKVFSITKTSRWDCVCDEVTQADVDALKTPGQVTRWVVLGCE